MNIVRSLALLTLVGISAPGIASAGWVNDNLVPFVVNSGNYIVASSPGDACTQGFKVLHIAIDPKAGTIEEVFTGEGEINGLPTAGQQVISVSLSQKRPILNLGGEKSERTVVSGKSIVIQTSTWAPLFGEFGGWDDEDTLVVFNSDNSLTLSYGGYHCLFQRNGG